MRLALLISAVLVGCETNGNEGPNTSRTGAFEIDEISVDVFTTVESSALFRPAVAMNASIVLHERGHELFVGEGDDIFLDHGGRRKKGHSNPNVSFSFVPSSTDEDLEASLVRNGRVFPIPIWKAPLPTVTARRDVFSSPDVVEVDVSPRPAPHTKVWLALGSCIASASVRVDVEVLPLKVDVAKDGARSEACCEGEGAARRCAAHLEADFESVTHPFENGPFDRSSRLSTHHMLKVDTFLPL